MKSDGAAITGVADPRPEAGARAMVRGPMETGMDDVERRAGASLYETDFYAWTQRQAALLREGRLAAADLPNILDEIETLGRSELKELR